MLEAAISTTCGHTALQGPHHAAVWYATTSPPLLCGGAVQSSSPGEMMRRGRMVGESAGDPEKTACEQVARGSCLTRLACVQIPSWAEPRERQWPQFGLKARLECCQGPLRE